ncbi:MAG: hypothetical protein E7008_02780 [Alphaproteobacteria bacterium]|nr:hypothetical protein [Alphaproteobacteria bacterium]
MKKLTAGIFTVMLGLCATSGADAAVASKGYVDSFVGEQGSITSAVTSLTQTVTNNKTAAENATKAVADDLAGYKTTNDAAVQANADAIATAEQDIDALETTVNDETNGLVAKVATLQQDIENVQGGSLTLKDGSISKAKLDESLQTEIDSFQNAEEVSGAIETALGDYTTTTDLNAALELKGDKTAVETNAANIATNTSAIATLNGDENTTGSVAKSIADAFTAANLDQYAKTSAMETALTSYALKSSLKALAYKDTVGTDDIDNLAVTTAKLADGAVQSGKIANGAVTDEKISAVSSSKVTGLSESLAEKLTIPTAANETDGKYVLTATSANGQATYYWELIAREGE